MLGAIIGDIVGSRFEFDNIDTKKFKFFDSDCFPTDDSIMTLAIADAIMAWEEENAHSKKDYERLSALAVEKMQSWGRKYPADYGYSFGKWLDMKNPQPYNSCGNGAAMRVSPVGWAAKDLDDCLKMAEAVTKVTHNHPAGIKGAQSTAVQIFLARQGKTIAELKNTKMTTSTLLSMVFHGLDIIMIGLMFVMGHARLPLPVFMIVKPLRMQSETAWQLVVTATLWVLSAEVLQKQSMAFLIH